MMDERIKRRLELFIWKADKLRNQNFIKHLREQGGIEHTLTISDDEGAYSQHTGPNTDAIEAASVTYRLFTLNKEPVSFAAMAKLLDSTEISEDCKVEFRRLRSAVNSILDTALPADSGGKTLTPRYVVDIYLNGGILHTDSDKVDIFRAWQADTLYFPELEFEVIATIADVSRAIFELADLCRQELAALQEAQ